MGKQARTRYLRQGYAAGFQAGITCDTEIWMEAIKRTTSLTPEVATELAKNVIRVAHERGEQLDQIRESGDLQLDERTPGDA